MEREKERVVKKTREIKAILHKIPQHSAINSLTQHATRWNENNKCGNKFHEKRDKIRRNKWKQIVQSLRENGEIIKRKKRRSRHVKKKFIGYTRSERGRERNWNWSRIEVRKMKYWVSHLHPKGQVNRKKKRRKKDKKEEKVPSSKYIQQRRKLIYTY